ncbi:fimbrillin family protein [uncultured Odoribacter sp.]|uniref:fimbrillin family protein n=1 Tax=uncultured Odoribacter sp. TaxID=876416 RepID=UPI0026223553|nr:fimbrillin family protein [uncultured Odoribacter sp.]
MKIKNILGMMLLLSLFFVACDNDDDIRTDNGLTVKFSSSIDGLIPSRAVGSGWESNDAIGVYMLKTGQALSEANIVDGAANREYVTASGDGNFAPAVGQTILYPADGSSVDFIAYYPYATIAAYQYAVNVENQTSQPDIDLLYANNAKGLNKDNTAASLTFSHQLAKMVFNIKAGSGISSLEGLNITLNGMKTQASFALADGTLAVDNASGKELTVKMSPAVEGVVGEAIILPVNALNDGNIVFTLPMGAYKWNIPAGQEYAKGKKYTYDVELTNSGGGITASISATIEDWVDAPRQNINIDFGNTTLGDGTKENPYSVNQALTLTQDGVWVGGYISGVEETRSAYTVKTNILLAGTAGETDRSKCVLVQLTDGSDIQKALNLVDHPDLEGKFVKVLGNVANGIVANVTEQVGGITSDPQTQVIFTEKFDGTDLSGGSKVKIGSYTGFDNGTGLVFSDEYGTADVRYLKSTANNNVWFPASKDASLKISGINTAGYTNIKLTYEAAANVFNAGASINLNTLKVYWNDQELTVPGKVVSKDNNEANVFFEMVISSGMSASANAELKFVALGAENDMGLRLDNIKLVGDK